MPLQPMQNGVHVQTAARPREQPKAEETTEHNYGQILLVLADEYMAATEKVEKDSEDYFKLVSFALGCIESVLKNYQLPPLKTAQISLTYARLLYEHTENYDEAEKTTSKAIEICEQNKFLDLKYALTLLSVRLLYQTKPKAALKFLLAQIEEMETYKHVAWLYLFYFEAANLNLLEATRDFHHAIHQLEKMEQLAARHHDRAVVSFAALMSALVHLQTAHTDAVSAAQQAIARSRSEQLDRSMKSLPQLRIAIEFMDVCCSKRTSNQAEVNLKRDQLIKVWEEDGSEDHPAWSPPGSLYIPIHSSSLRDAPLQTGGLIAKHNGEYVLPFSWLTKDNANQICYLLCAVCHAPANSSEKTLKAEQYCKTALQELREGQHPRVSAVNREVQECRVLIELAFLLCMRSKWDLAVQQNNQAKRLIMKRRQAYPDCMAAATVYLSGCIAQGLGQLDKALKSFEHQLLDPRRFIRDPDLSCTTPSQVIRSSDLESQVMRNFSVLALINRLFIIDQPNHPQHHNKASMINLLNIFTQSTTAPIQDRNVSTACLLAHSLLTKSAIWVDKERMVAALASVKEIQNQQLQSLLLAGIQEAFMKGATDKHALACFKAAWGSVYRWRDQTWLHVMQGVSAEMLGFQGKMDEQREKEGQARVSWEALPEGLKRGLDWDVEPVGKAGMKV
jgi:tetratricopeptide (TPR) repeat protein